MPITGSSVTFSLTDGFFYYNDYLYTPNSRCSSSMSNLVQDTQEKLVCFEAPPQVDELALVFTIFYLFFYLSQYIVLPLLVYIYCFPFLLLLFFAVFNHSRYYFPNLLFTTGPYCQPIHIDCDDRLSPSVAVLEQPLAYIALDHHLPILLIII